MKNFCRSSLTALVVFTLHVPVLASSDSNSETELDVDVGYQLVKAPTPATHQCLDFQEVCGKVTTVHMGSAVQPFIAVDPKNHKKIVSVFQQDRISNGGSLEAGIVFSHNAGKTWRHAIVPFQICNGGLAQRTTDHTLAFTKDGKKLFLSGTVFNATEEPDTHLQSAIVVTTSKTHGRRWDKPIVITSSQATLNHHDSPVFQKPFITADPNSKHHAYISWNEFSTKDSVHAPTVFSYTKNGGKKWVPPRIIYDPGFDISHDVSNGNPQDTRTYFNTPIVLPEKSSSKSLSLSGDVLNFMTRIYARPCASSKEFKEDHFPYGFTAADLAFIRSTDHGKNWCTHAKVIATLDPNAVIFTGGYNYDINGQICGGVGTKMRTEDFGFSVAVNPKNGYLYAVWQTGQFRPDRLSQIALITSRNGGHTWSDPVMINRTSPFSLNPQAFTPRVAVTKFGYVGIMYSDFRNDDLCDPHKTLTDTWLAIYEETEHAHGGDTGVGLDFHKEVRLSQESYIAQHGPTTTKGVMTNGDYDGLTAHADRFYAVYTKSFNALFADEETFFEASDESCFSTSTSSCSTEDVKHESEHSCDTPTSSSSSDHSTCSDSTESDSSHCSDSSNSSSSSSSCCSIPSSSEVFSTISSLSHHSSSSSVRGASMPTSSSASSISSCCILTSSSSSSDSSSSTCTSTSGVCSCSSSTTSDTSECSTTTSSSRESTAVVLDQNLRTRPFVSIVEQ